MMIPFDFELSEKQKKANRLKVAKHKSVVIAARIKNFLSDLEKSNINKSDIIEIKQTINKSDIIEIKQTIKDSLNQ